MRSRIAPLVLPERAARNEHRVRVLVIEDDHEVAGRIVDDLASATPGGVSHCNNSAIAAIPS